MAGLKESLRLFSITIADRLSIGDAYALRFPSLLQSQYGITWA